MPNIPELKIGNTTYKLKDGDLRSALNSEMDGIFFDVANDKYASGSFHGITYNLTGNTVKLNGTANGGFRLKVSGANADVASAVPDSWKSESIGLITGHKYILGVEYVSGTGSKSTVAMYNSSGSSVTSVDVDPSLATARNLMFSDSFTATNSNAAYLVIYTTTSRIHNNLIVRFNFVDVTMAYDLIQNKIGLQTAEENVVISLLQNRYAASGMVDFGSENGFVAYSNLMVTVKGNRLVINGTTSNSARIKITNGLDAQHTTPSSWYNESIPVPDTNHEYIIAISKLSGSVSSNTNCSVAMYNKDGTSGNERAYFVTASDGFDKGTAYSGIIKNIGNVACLFLYFPNGSDLSNVVLQVELIDITVLKTLNEYVLDKNCGLHDYYFDGDYITGRINDIIALRAGASIHNASFLWFTDPHYYRPSASEQENGMQSAQIARYLKRELNNRYVICGGDMLRGTLTKSVCRENLIKAREYMDEIYDDLYMCLGNHEYNNPGDTSAQQAQELASPELYEMLCKHQEMAMASVSTRADYSYIDKAQKIQYFILDCDNAADLFPESITWLASELLTVGNGYHVVIISHIGLTTGSDDQNRINSKFYDVRDIIDAVNSRGTFAYSGTSYNYGSVNFEIVCALTGHVHYDGNATTPGGTPIIATTCDRAFVGSDGDAGIREVRKIGTIGEQALDYVLIDFDNHTIDLIRIGGSILGASYDSGTGKIYDTATGTATEYTGAEWVAYSPYKDRHFTYTGHIT